VQYIGTGIIYYKSMNNIYGTVNIYYKSVVVHLGPVIKYYRSAKTEFIVKIVDFCAEFILCHNSFVFCSCNN